MKIICGDQGKVICGDQGKVICGDQGKVICGDQGKILRFAQDTSLARFAPRTNYPVI